MRYVVEPASGDAGVTVNDVPPPLDAGADDIRMQVPAAKLSIALETWIDPLQLASAVFVVIDDVPAGRLKVTLIDVLRATFVEPSMGEVDVTANGDMTVSVPVISSLPGTVSIPSSDRALIV
jgi:hypothetical protein